MSRYQPRISLPSGITWVALNYDDILSTLDPAGIAADAITMDGDNFVVPVSVALDKMTLSTGLTMQFAIPAGICDGSNGLLFVRISLSTGPAGAYGAVLGVYNSGVLGGMAAGCRNASGDSKMRPLMSRGAGSEDGETLSATALVSHGIVELPGSWDGVDVQAMSGSSYLEEGGPSRTAGTFSTPAAAIAAATTRLALCVVHNGTDDEGETLTFKAERGTLADPWAA